MKKQIVFAIVLVAQLSSAYALSNEQFVKEVQRHIQVLEKDEKALKEASEFCALLSSERRRNEPRCVAAERVELLKMTGPSRVRIR